MLTGFIGDIHGNIDALEAALETLRAHRVERIICTGDIVGYGACPRECIDLIRQLRIPSVLGNHDHYTTQIGGDWSIRPAARHVIRWTQAHLERDYVDWLANLPMNLDYGTFTVRHASHVWFPDWPYVVNRREVIQHLLFQPRRLCFNGHCHAPVRISHRAGKPVAVDSLGNLLLPRNQRLTIGVGSVGQPRDGDWRAAVVIFDENREFIRLLRVPYPVEKARQRILDARFPSELADRLLVGH
jgi:predicted phosphodiesterase